MSKNKEMQICSICGVSELDTRFYYNSKHGENLCNKHYTQLVNRGKITDPSKPDINYKKTFWTSEEERKLIDLVNEKTPYEEIAIILNKRSSGSISDKVASMGIETKYPNSSKFKAIYQDYDWCYQKYIVEGLNHDEMALEAKAKKRVVEKWCVEKHRLTQEYRQIHKQLSDKQKDLIIGSMLGDGHIDKRETQPIFIVVHAENQKDYLYYKYELLKEFCNISPTRQEAGFREFNGKLYPCQATYRICTRIQDCFLEYRGKTYTYLLNLMNEFSFSIWMLDDGYRSNSNWELCICEYTEEDINNALNIFKDKFGLVGKLKKDIRYLMFDAVSSRKIDAIILKNIPSELDIIKNKITENNISVGQKFLYVKYNNEDIKLHELCKDLNLDYKYVWQKLKRGSSIEEIIEQKAIAI